jgi:outer membrane protein OmpA-like peptidoglycan-associated protein
MIMMRQLIAKQFGALFLLGAALLPATARAADVPGGKDHPLVGRYEGSEIVGYRAKAFDEVKIVSAPFTPVGTTGLTGEGFQTLEGREILIYYKLPEGRSSLEALRNYEPALKAKGFTTLFTCNAADGSCFVGKSPEAPYLIGAALGDPNGLPRLVDDYPHNWFGEKARYLLARADTPAGAVYASLSFGESARGTVAVVRIVETTEMEANKIVVLSAGEMEKALEKDGRVNIYSLYFDFDKDTLRPESKPTLDEIAKLMSVKPGLRLQIVGHTDNKGTPDYNIDLSNRRAGNVVDALTGGHGVEESRLSSAGKGFNEPVASNDSEDGRAKNRRVELVAQ